MDYDTAKYGKYIESIFQRSKLWWLGRLYPTMWLNIRC